MSKKQVAILWGVNIALYIVNIILICIKGPTLTTCILGWVLASILAGLVIYLQCRLIDRQKTIEEINKEWLKSIKDWKAIIKDKDKYIEWLIKTNDIKF